MATVHDVVAYILARQGGMSAMKLQKLVYYAQAWSLVWDDQPLFRARIEAWANGPVVPSLYRMHKGQFRISTWPAGDPSKLTKDERDTVDAVVSYYGKRSAQWLSDLTHAEKPWKDAREGLEAGQRGDNEITLASMMEYYSTIPRRTGRGR
jgi:uncharacterized phage-associated protein